MVELAKFLERMITMKSQDLILILLKDNWKETFGALDYLPSNYNIFSGQFRNRYLEFLENDSTMISPRANVPQEFTKQVQVRYMAMFLFEYVMISHFAEENVMFVATVCKIYSR
jgi:hypothetical protein